MKISYTIVAFVLVLSLAISAVSATEYLGPVLLEPQLSSNGNTLYKAIPAVVVMADPNPSAEWVSIAARFDMLTLPETATASFSITYVANGGTDPWGASCTTFPEEAKAAFNAAAAIWGNLLQSSVPITISACWSNLGSSSILGYSGGGPIHKDFTGAPRANTWYGGSLANALAGSDLALSDFDMHITYNINFPWYYGTDGVTPSGQYDLMSIVLHEIAHGLNFSGSMSYSGGTGRWGYGSSPAYPNIYDTFMRDGTANPGNLLIDTGVYTNPSTALGSALTSDSIWFHGTNAMAANGDQRVKMYAPSTWNSGSSYSHLDYNTFAGGENRLMIYAISSGVSIHDPGPVTLGIFKDMGWPKVANTNTWTQKADFGGTARESAVGFSIGSKGYIGTGYDGSSLKKDFWEYDTAANAWTQKANFGGTVREEAVGFSIGSKGYIGMGYDASSNKKDFWEYDPAANTWTQKANFGGTARSSAVGFSIGGKGYIGTGIDGPSSFRKDFWEYDPTANTWTQKANFGGTARGYAVGFSIGGKGYIGTGSSTKDFWEYDPTANTWTQKADFGGTARAFAVGFSIGGKGYIGTGSYGSYFKDLWEYDPSTTADTVVYATFTGGGLWKWDGSTWSQITPNVPIAMAASGSLLYGNFLPGGIWQWDSTTWSQVTPNAPTAMAASGSLLYGVFLPGGIWQWNGTAWSQVTSNVPTKITASGSVLYGNFGTGAGIWKWDGTTWSQITPNAPTAMAVSDSLLYGVFMPGGIWQWNGTAWSQVTSNVPTKIAASGSVLYGVFSPGGIWKWDGTAWNQVTPSVPQDIAVSGSILYGDFGTGGIWKWDGTTWSQVTPSDPTSMITGS